MCLFGDFPGTGNIMNSGELYTWAGGETTAYTHFIGYFAKLVIPIHLY